MRAKEHLERQADGSTDVGRSLRFEGLGDLEPRNGSMGHGTHRSIIEDPWWTTSLLTWQAKQVQYLLRGGIRG